tara:strand:- start:326 stop:718 length:393 start_codon:yes stop_codon:yes gene_type:complete
MMTKIEEIKEFKATSDVLWNIISDIGRSDWVPGVESIKIEGNKRIFKMAGMGRLVEEIIECNHKKMELSYSAIETMAPIQHHLAKIKLTSNEQNTIFSWTTEIDPPDFADAIRQGMLASLDELEKLLKNS